MATGVPETEVFAAADAVLARGERPTVERVRTEVGRGSPARVGQLLEQWWEQLARRLKGHALLPELPGEVAGAFTEAWRVALTHASTAAEAALTEQQNTLFAEQASLTQERKLWEIALAATQTDLAETTKKLDHAEIQLSERQGLLDRLTAEVADGRTQRDHLQGDLARRQTELEELRADHAAIRGHIRTTEDRAHQQIDQARQEVKTLKHALEQSRRDQAKQLADLTEQHQALLTALRAAEQTVAHQAGQLTALEATIRRQPPPRALTPKRAPGKTPATKTTKPGRSPRKR